jgi:UDP-glucose 4-epimerase
VTTFIKRALGDEPLSIFGDGQATRDFIHVQDLCAGIVSAVATPEASGVIHLASERETSIRELAALIIELTGAEVPIEHLPARPGEVERNFAIARHAADVLGFRATVGLEDGMADTIDWFRATRDVWDAGEPSPQ